MSVVPAHGRTPHPTLQWSSRILLLAVAGIIFLTLYPFRFDFATAGPHRWFPLLLRGWGKDAGPLNVFLNILLFVPYGFGVALKLRERGASNAWSLGYSVAAGALLSYFVEVLQFYIPQRDSGWGDIFANSAGSAAGFFAADWLGFVVLRSASHCEGLAKRVLTPKRAVAICLLYLTAWFALSIPLQKEVNLTGWDPNCFLAVGNRAKARPAWAWKGEISELQFWSRSLPDDTARSLTSAQVDTPMRSAPLVSYDFAGSAPFRDSQGFLSELDWSARPLTSVERFGARFDGATWLIARAPASALVQAISQTNQFSLHIVCTPAQRDGGEGWILSISNDAAFGNIELRQDDDKLVLWFRNSVARRWHRITWDHTGVLSAGERRNILFTYDGSSLKAFIDGKEQRGYYELGPGASLAMLIGRAKNMELIGYEYIYLALVFFPAGCLLGFAQRNCRSTSSGSLLLVVLGVAISAVLLESVLVHLSGRPASIGRIVLSSALVLAGSLWINLDRGDRLAIGHAVG